jgi:hypothetical protein
VLQQFSTAQRQAFEQITPGRSTVRPLDVTEAAAIAPLVIALEAELAP